MSLPCTVRDREAKRWSLYYCHYKEPRYEPSTHEPSSRPPTGTDFRVIRNMQGLNCEVRSSLETGLSTTSELDKMFKEDRSMQQLIMVKEGEAGYSS